MTEENQGNEVDIGKTLIYCLHNVTTASFTKRKEIVKLLTQCCESRGFQDGHLKGISKIICMTVTKYKDSKSRRLVLGFLDKYITRFEISGIKCLLTEMHTLVNRLVKHDASLDSASCGLTLMTWCMRIMKACPQEQAVLKILNELEVLCYSMVCACDNNRVKRLQEAAYKCLQAGKTTNMLLRNLDNIINNDKYQVESLCYVGFIFQYLTKQKEIETVDEIKKKALIDIVIKNCIQSKLKVNHRYLEFASPFLKYVTHDEFKEILPAVEKGLLRNPETIMKAVGYLLKGQSIDLSNYMNDLSKFLAVHLISKNQSLQVDTVFAIDMVVKQSSDANAIDHLLKHIIKVLNGSEGKLVSTEQRSAILQALKVVSNTSVSGSEHMENLATTVHDGLFPAILQEGNEGILILALNVMKTWCKYFTNKIPKNFVDNIKKGVALKISSTIVQAHYFLVAGEAIKGNTISQAAGLVDTLLHAVEKVKGQTHLANNVFHCITASTVLMRMLLSDDIQVGGSKLEGFWNLVLDPVKKVLVSEKFLGALQQEHLHQLYQCMNILFIHYPSKLIRKTLEPWYHAINILLLHGDWKTRKAVKLLLVKIFDSGNFDVKEFQLKLFSDLNDMLEQYSHKDHKDDENEDAIFPIKNVVDTYTYLCVCDNNKTEELLYELLKDCFIYFHHPLLYENEPCLFGKVAKTFKVDGGKLFVEKFTEDLVKYFTELPSFSKASENALATLLSLHPDALLVTLVEQVKDCLTDPAVSNVTHNDYQIMLTPEGEAFDQSVFHSAKAASQKSANVKRESKAYSYKDQKAEMELREELQKKKGQVEKKIELNKKQKEQLQAILTQEKAIRDRLKLVEEKLIKYTTILSKLLAVENENLYFYYEQLKSIMLRLLQSYIAAPHIIPVFKQLSQKLFIGELKYLGEFIANVILRLQKPVCDLLSGWTDENLVEQAKRALNTLHTFVSERNVNILMTYTRKKPFSAPTFGFCVPLLKHILKDQGAFVKGNEELRMKALQLILVHSKLRSSKDELEVDENGPELLPRKELLNILSDVIVACEGHNKEAKLQQQANHIFDEVCKCASGKPGCAVAGVEEIEILLANILSQCSVLRNASLKGLLELLDVIPNESEVIMTQLTKRVLIGRFDLIEENAKLAKSIWESAELSIHPTMIHELVDDVIHPLDDVRLAASLALGVALEENRDIDILPKLLEIYNENLKIPPPVIDNLGRVVSTPFIDPWEARQGVGLALEKTAPYVSTEKLGELFNFFVPTALGDRNDHVRKQMLEASLQYVNLYGQENMDLLLGIFHDFLDSAPDSSEQDTIRQSVIILTGSIAKHFDKNDPQIKPIFAKLMAALSTPSQSVQQAVANCLPPLCGAMKDEAPQLVKKLLNQLLESESYGERRGAAFGLAGLVKGLGILSLKQQNIINTLNEAIQNKKIWRYREGALFAFETLCTMLGRLFEPYVVHLLPHLLLCFGDGNQYVREAADETAKAVMKNLSNHGVKLVLPSLLKALEEEAWRTKTGSAELLGAMSFCAPKQLSSCLPNIVPRLTEVLADSHLKVQKAGQQALRQIGGVIRNPEIQEICPIILDALSDPNKHTVACLQALLSTSFVHFIDAPSLALIMPTLEKALGQRPTETKKMAAQILGNMYALTDPKDLSPYLAAVVPGLKKSLLDPSPEVRAVSARALGAIVKGMGDECYNDLMPWLLETLTSEVSSVDRSGAAQGLSEVLFALGQEKLDKLMPDVITTTMKTELAPNVRDGYLMLYIYLPATFEDDFMEYIGPIVPAILKGLADESEYVRDTSLKAGQRIINMYADSAIELLLPELEAGLFDEHWRIRLSSVTLLGDLLFKLSGVTGKQSTVSEEDDNFGTAHSAQIILETLGHERRDRVYAGLYMGRSDVALPVRQAALHVWKVIVQNTAKTLREILPVLFELLLSCLASQSYDKRQVAARTLGDLVRKLGERILPEIIPILEAGLENEDGDKRQGVCIGLSEIMDSTSREMISQFEESLITTIRKALIDELADVRYAASLSFENLHNTIGHRALDGVLPDVFKKLDDPELSEYALDGLKQVMAVKSKSVLPFLVPKLTTPPVNTKALAILSSVAGEALIKHIEKILPAMIQAIQTATNNGEDGASELDGTRTLLISVEDEVGLRTIVDELIASSKHQNPGIRKVTADLLTIFCKETRGDYLPYVQPLFRTIIQLMNDVDSDVVLSAWSSLDALVKRLDPSEQLQHLNSLRQAVRYIKDDIRNEQLPGFCIPKKGITPVLPIFREGILNGPQEVKEQAANGLGEIIKLTSSEALRPSVVHITGPLIRILGDRFNSSVKVAILDTLGLLLKKVGILLKPFLPQLQTTFVKSLNDSSLGVRQKAAWALSLLTVLHTRVDSLFTELKNGIKNNEDNAIRETILGALRNILLKAGGKMSEGIRTALLETLMALISSTEDGVRVKSAAALGAMCHILPEENIKNLLNKNLLEINQMLDWTLCHGRSVALSYALYDAPSQVFNSVDEDDIVEAVVKYSNYDRVPICMYGVHSLGHLLMFSKENKDAAPQIVVSSLKKCMVNSSNDIRLASLNTLKHISKHKPEVLTFDRIRYLIPEFISLLRDRNSAVRALAELTLAFVLQLDKNDVMFDECVSTITEASNFLEEYKKSTFSKLSDSLATDKDDYLFVT